MILSQTALYALKAAVYLAESSDGDTPVRVDDIADELGVPRNYLSKILHGLTREGVLVSTRGPGGGFRLADRPDVVSLATVVRPFDDFGRDPGCVMGRERCTDTDPCNAHTRWKEVFAGVRDFFEETTLGDLTRDRSLVPEPVPG